MLSEVLYHFLLRGYFPCTKHAAVKDKVGGKGQGTADYMATFARSSPPFPLIRIAAAAKSLQLCPTLCDPIDFPIPGIIQARTPEWVAISFSNAWKWKVKVKSLSHVQLFATPWTAAYEAPPSMGFSRQEY